MNYVKYDNAPANEYKLLIKVINEIKIYMFVIVLCRMRNNMLFAFLERNRNQIRSNFIWCKSTLYIPYVSTTSQ